MNMLKSTTALALAIGLGIGFAAAGPASAAGEKSTSGTSQTAGEKATSGTSQTQVSPSAPEAGTGAGAATAGTAKSGMQSDKSGASQMSSEKSPADTPATGTSHIAGGVRADELVGRNVVNKEGENVGEVAALVIQPERNEIHAVISVGGFLGMGDHEVAIPLKELEIGEDNVTLMSQQTKEDLKALPEYDGKEWRAWEGDSPTTPQTKSQ
jgi:sporulation protein YlmC with PRC-barrel domain